MEKISKNQKHLGIQAGQLRSETCGGQMCANCDATEETTKESYLFTIQGSGNGGMVNDGGIDTFCNLDICFLLPHPE